MISSEQFRALAEDLVPVTLEAGRAIMRHFGADPTVFRKHDESPVTAADQEAEDLLLPAIARAAPGIPIVAEEQVSAGHVPAVGDELFLVDPLDGTRGFIKGRSEFTVNVGYVRDGLPCFGIVYAPALSKLYVTLDHNVAIEADADPNGPARQLGDLSWRRLQTRAIDRRNLSAVSSRHVSKVLAARLEELGVARVDANSSIKFCMLARGDVDFYPRFGEIREWDTAAGAAIVIAAGGCMTDLDGRPTRYGKAAGGFRNPAFVAWATRTPPADLVAVINRSD